MVRTHAGPSVDSPAQFARKEQHTPVAQRLERRAHTTEVAGSNPAWRTANAFANRRAGSSAVEQPVDNGQVARSKRARRIP